MFTLESPMAKGRGGRPKKSDGEQPTRHVRVFEDLADMIGWIYHFESQEEKTSVAQILDPMLRAQVAARFAPYAEKVKKILAAEQEAPQLPASGKKGRKPT
jgi:hypothetical protein